MPFHFVVIFFPFYCVDVFQYDVTAMWIFTFVACGFGVISKKTKKKQKTEC